MKRWSELSLKGKVRRLNLVYNLLDTETSEKIYTMYNTMFDKEYDKYFLEDLREAILYENKTAVNFNTRVGNLTIKDYLEW